MMDVERTERSAEVVLPEPVAVPVTALEVLNRTEIDVAVSTARRYPRSLALFKQSALAMIKLDQETAASCFYALPRRQTQADGSVKRITVTGPSVRLAELAQIAWRNMRAGARIIAETDREIVAQGWAHDVESNVAVMTETRRRIVDRHGRRYSDDLVITTANAACSIAMRNAIFRVIPRALVTPLLDAAMKVAAGEAKTLGEGRQRALAAFADLGVSTAQILDKLERRGVEDIDLEDLGLLAGLLNALRERETTVDAEFPHAPPEGAPTSRTAAVADAVRRRRAASAAAGGGGPEPPATPPSDTPTPDDTAPSTETTTP
jgi:hypothetical protein